jgi:hypothetical protein
MFILCCEATVDVYERSYISMVYLYMNGMLTMPNELRNMYEIKKCEISSKLYLYNYVLNIFRCSLKKVNSKCIVIVL